MKLKIIIAFLWQSVMSLGLFGLNPVTMVAVPPPRAAQSTFFLMTKGTPLVTVLQDLGAYYDIPVIVSHEVNDIFVGELQSSNLEYILKKMAQLYNLVWYNDNQTLHIYKANEVRRAVITPSFLNASKLRNHLEESGALSSKSCSIKLIKKFNAFEVFGVPVCIQRIKRLTKELDNSAKQQEQSQEEIQVFPLNYAAAEDVVYQYRQKEVVIPGVITTLKEMYKQGTEKLIPNQVLKNDVTKQIVISNPVFSVEPRQNAIVVKDKKVLMPLYKKLIESLDKRPVQIEISVSIIDVNAADLKQLGVEWSAGAGRHHNHQERGLALNVLSGAPNAFSSVIHNTAQFFSKLEALQQVSKAKILSQPSVVTLNNMQAILDKNTVFYTKILGEKFAKLESVVTGTLLRVTPRIIAPSSKSKKSAALEQVDPTSAEILLQLNIQDGQPHELAGGDADGIPRIQNSEISTQAHLKAGASLLLGGFIQDKVLQTKYKTPFFADIPLVGFLFQGSKKERSSVVRLFLIKATPIQLSGT